VTLTEVFAAVLLVMATAFVLLTALGLWRFDDLYSRIHAATKAVTMGVLLVIAAAVLRVESSTDVVKLLLAGVLQLISSPVSGHMLARAAYWAGTPLSPHTVIDELNELGRTESRDPA
jgi:multicomponent Na+:H+ antiporter subunit G